MKYCPICEAETKVIASPRVKCGGKDLVMIERVGCGQIYRRKNVHDSCPNCNSVASIILEHGQSQCTNGHVIETQTTLTILANRRDDQDVLDKFMEDRGFTLQTTPILKKRGVRRYWNGLNARRAEWIEVHPHSGYLRRSYLRGYDQRKASCIIGAYPPSIVNGMKCMNYTFRPGSTLLDVRDRLIKYFRIVDQYTEIQAQRKIIVDLIAEGKWEEAKKESLDRKVKLTLSSMIPRSLHENGDVVKKVLDMCLTANRQKFIDDLPVYIPETARLVTRDNFKHYMVKSQEVFNILYERMSDKIDRIIQEDRWGKSEMHTYKRKLKLSKLTGN